MLIGKSSFVVESSKFSIVFCKKIFPAFGSIPVEITLCLVYGRAKSFLLAFCESM